MKKLLPVTILLWVGLVSGYAQNKPRSEQIRNIHISQLVADGTKNGNQIIAINSDGTGLILKSLPALEIQTADITDWNKAVEIVNLFSIENPQKEQLLRYNDISKTWENWTPDFLKSTGTIDVAKKLETARIISLTGDVTASGTFDGSTNLSLNAQIASGAITNSEVAVDAAIAGTKITPSFGSQNIFTDRTVNAVDGLILGKDGGGQIGSIMFRDEGSPPNTLTLRPPKKINNPSYTLIFPDYAPGNSELLQIKSIDKSNPENTIGTLEWASTSQYSAQTLTAVNDTPDPGAKLNLSQSGGTVRLYGDGATSVTYEGNNTIKIYSSDSYGPTYRSGMGISISESNEISATTESLTDEAQTLSAAGDTSPTINLSPVGSTGGGTITLEATSPIKLAQDNNKITISSDAPTNMSIADDVTLASPVYPIWAAGTGSQPLKISTTKLGFIPSKGVIIANGMIIHGDEDVPGGSFPTGDNIRLGKSSTGVAPIGQRNIAIGTESMITLMLAGNAIDNVGIGFNTLNKMTSGNANIAIGSYALEASQTADFNMAIGEGAFKVLDEPESDGNIAIGFYAGSEKVNPKYTTVIGTRAFELGTGGEGNTSLGYFTLHKTTGNNNTAIGASALVENTTGIDNTALGAYALQNSTTSNSNTGLGFKALNANTLGNTNTAIGASSLILNTTGSDNTAVGYHSLYKNATVSELTAVGSYALSNNSTGLRNTAVGYNSLFSNTAGDNNVGLGYQALQANVGDNNTALGMEAMMRSIGGRESTGVGVWALRNQTTGQENTGVGAFALLHNAEGINNVAIGSYSGHILGIDGQLPGQGDVVHNVSNSVYLGHNTRSQNTDGINNEIIIGALAYGHGSNTINLNYQREPKLFIGNSEPNDRIYYEPLYYDKVGAPGTVLAGIGTGKMPRWKGITITSSDGTVGFGSDQDTDSLIWDLSVTCCKPLNLIGGGDISVTQGATSQDWTISYIDNDKDPTNELQKLKIDPNTGEISLVGTDGNPIPVVDQDGKEVPGSDGKPLTSIVFSGLTFDPLTKTFKLPCPCDEVVKGKIMIEQSDELTAKAEQTLFDLTAVPDVDSKLKMYINGLRISNTAYTVDGTKLTYHPELNVLQGTLHGGELIQFDYSSSE